MGRGGGGTRTERAEGGGRREPTAKGTNRESFFTGVQKIVERRVGRDVYRYTQQDLGLFPVVWVL